MQETILYWIEDIPVELATALLAMLPITELRASLPVAITVFGLDPLTALIYSLIGNAVPLLFIFWFNSPDALAIKRAIYSPQWFKVVVKAS